jgi:hypothetical protein
VLLDSEETVGFDFDKKDKIEIVHSCLLTEVKPIIPEDHQLFQQLKSSYDKIDENSTIYVKAACTLVNSILTQERLYFALSGPALKKLFEKDPNLKFKPESFSGTTWRKILAKCYNQFGLFKLYQKGKGPRNANMYRLSDKALADFLLGQGVDALLQKEETLAFVSVDFNKVSKD